MTYIQHHGISGQKWGVRHGPPYPLSRGKSGRISGNSESKNGPNRDGKDTTSYHLMMMAFSIVTLRPITFAYEANALVQNSVAKSKEKKVINRLEKNTNIDKETGFKLKNQEFTKEQDMSQVNPGFKNFNTDTKNNCVLCSLTYDLRRKGYDVTANKVGQGFTPNEIKDIVGKSMTSFGNSKYQARYLDNNADAKAFEEHMSKQPDQRGMLTLSWNNSFSGHAMAYEVENGKMVIRDCQSNKVYNDPKKILKKGYNYQYVRTDNIKLNKKRLKEICHS